MLLNTTSFELANKKELNPSFAYFFDTKYDGTRNFVVVNNYKITSLSTRRNIDNLDKFPHLKEIKMPFKEGILDCEIVVFDELGRTRLDLIMRKENWSNAKIIIFDIISLDGEDLRRLPQHIRRNHLENFGIREAKHTFFQFLQHSSLFISESHKDFDTAYKNTVGLEGFMAKINDAQYIGKRGDRWLKFAHRKEATILFRNYETHPTGITLFNDLVRVACNGQQHLSVKQRIDEGEEIKVEIQYLRKTEAGKYFQPTFKRMILA